MDFKTWPLSRFHKTTGSYGVSGSSQAAILIAQIHLSQSVPRSGNDNLEKIEHNFIDFFRGSENKLLGAIAHEKFSFFGINSCEAFGDFLDTCD